MHRVGTVCIFSIACINSEPKAAHFVQYGIMIAEERIEKNTNIYLMNANTYYIWAA